MKSLCPTTLLLFVVLFNTCYCLVMCADINWSTLTSAELNNLNSNVFQSISAEQLAQIPISACSGFRADQISNLKATACSGFTSAQVSNLDNSNPSFACSGFVGACVLNMKVETFSGFNTQCVKQLTASTLNSISADQVANIPATSFAGFNSNSLPNLSPNACKGITASQISNLDNSNPSYACSGFVADCLSAIPANSFSKISAYCVNRLTSNSLSKLSQNQTSQFAPTSFGGFTSTNIDGLSTDACSGIQSSQISFLDNTYPKYACSGIKSTCIANIPSSTFGSIQAACVKQLTISATSSLTKDQLSFISQSGIGGFTSDNIVGLKESCAGLSANQISGFDTTNPSDACKGIQRECISSIPSNSFSGFRGACIYQLSSNISVITIDQLSKMANDGIGGLSRNQISSFTSGICSGFTPDQIGSFNPYNPYFACQGFLPDCLSGLNMGVISNIQAICFQQIPSLSVKGFSPNAIPLLTSKTLRGLTSAQLKEFYKFFGLNQFINVLTQKQIETISYDAVFGFKNMLENKLLNRSRVIDQDELSTLSWLQLSVSTDESVKNTIKVSSIPSIMPQTFKGLLNYSQLFTDDFYTSFTIDQLGYLLSDTISSITQIQIENIPDTAFEIPHVFFQNFKYINLDAIKGVTKSQFSKLTGASYSLDNVMTCDQFRSLTQEQYNYLSTFNSYKTIYNRCYGPNPQPSSNPQSSTPRPIPPSPHNSNPRNGSPSSFVLTITLVVVIAILNLLL